MIICSSNNIDFIQGVIAYGNEPLITDWRIENSNGVLNVLNSKSTNANLAVLEGGNINITGNYNKNNRDVINDTSNYVLSTSNILVNSIRNEVSWGSNYSDLVGRYASNYVSSISFSGGSSQWGNGSSSSIFYNTGNVGIGTNNPINKLHIRDDTTNTTALTIQNNFIPSTITSSPNATTISSIGNYTMLTFVYTTETGGVGSGQTLYTITLPSGGVVCDVLIVGGGGGGGAGGGGGGGGGVLFATNITLTSGSIRVGRGGNGDTTAGDSTIGANGSNSSITINGTEYIAKGGGGGGVRGPNTRGISGAAGGSGGGGGPTHDAAYLGYGGASNKNTYSNFQSFGNAGGQGKPDANPPQPQLSSGGGGGAGGSGNNYSASTGGGNGGAGKSFETYFGTGVGHNGWFAGGGGGNSFIGSSFRAYGNGGNGLFGGGGNGGTDGDTTFFPVNGTANTGGGGGGGLFFGNPVSGANGGTGVVIIRYPSGITGVNIELIRGISGDSNIDYKVGNYGGDFKIISSSNNVDTDYVKITSAGAIFNPTGTSSWTTISDRRIKENIVEASYDKCYDNINNLGLYRFNYVEGFNNVNKDIKQLGFIAQEVKENFPKSVLVNNNYNIADLLTIDITQINYTLYGAVKKLIKQNEDKDRRIKRLETLLNIEDTTITSNIAIDTSNIAIDTSNIAIDTECYMNRYWQYINGYTCNLNSNTSNIAIDTSNIAIDTSNIALDTSNIVLDTSNITLDTSNTLPTTSNLSIDTSNIPTE